MSPLTVNAVAVSNAQRSSLCTVPGSTFYNATGTGYLLVYLQSLVGALTTGCAAPDSLSRLVSNTSLYMSKTLPFNLLVTQTGISGPGRCSMSVTANVETYVTLTLYNATAQSSRVRNSIGPWTYIYLQFGFGYATLADYSDIAMQPRNIRGRDYYNGTYTIW